MPTERPLVKCAEIFWCEDTLLLEYQCSTCMVWFNTHDKCADHVRSHQHDKHREQPYAVDDFEIKSEFKDDSVYTVEIIPMTENDSEFDADPEPFETKQISIEFTTAHEQEDNQHAEFVLLTPEPAPKPARRRRKRAQPKHVFETAPENESFSRLLTFYRQRNGRDLHCDLCGASGKTRVQMFTHMHREHIGQDLTCKRCGRTFKRLRDLRVHSRKYPPDPHACEFCGKTFSLKINFDNHVRIHTGERPFVCQECGQRFVQNSSLKVHMRVAHTGERPFQCSKCPMTFFTRYLMTQHDKREHLKVPRERTHRCEHCDKMFYDLDVLVDHIRTHTGEKPHVCEFCNRGFAKKYALSVHRNIHTGNAPCVCKYCDRAFHSSAARRSHEKCVHKMK